MTQGNDDDDDDDSTDDDEDYDGDEGEEDGDVCMQRRGPTHRMPQGCRRGRPRCCLSWRWFPAAAGSALEDTS